CKLRVLRSVIRHHSLLVSPALPHSLLFFFYGHGAHRDLHSFPTRRSSDLESKFIYASVASLQEHLLWGSFFAAVVVMKLPQRRRSEEHTSELQSLRHLVCRLLLEKKKQARQNTAYNLKHSSRIIDCQQLLH